MGLFFRTMKSYFPTGRYIIIDYVFCVLKGLIQLSKKGIFACYVIKKRRCCYSTVQGKETEDHFWEVEVGGSDAIQGTVDDVIYSLWDMKEPNYVMSMMDNGGRILADDTCKDTERIWI